MRITSIIFLLLFFIVITSCSTDNKPLDVSAINKTNLEKLISQKDLTLLVFYTSWCGASEYNYKNSYLPLYKQIIENDFNAQIIMIAGDDEVTEEKLKEIEKEGILAYRLHNAGTFPPKNRYKIRKFIESTFPNQEVERAQGFAFAIPVALIVNNKNEILNTTDSAHYSTILFNYFENNEKME